LFLRGCVDLANKIILAKDLIMSDAVNEKNDLNESVKGAVSYIEEKHKTTQGSVIHPNVIMTGINIPFFDLVMFLIKLAIASIPAGIIFIIFYGILTGLLGLLGLGAILNAIF